MRYEKFTRFPVLIAIPERGETERAIFGSYIIEPRDDYPVFPVARLLRLAELLEGAGAEDFFESVAEAVAKSPNAKSFKIKIEPT